MKRTQKYLSSEAHGYLREAEACSLVLKDLERISAKLQRRIDREVAARQADFEAAMQYHSEAEIQDAYGWEFITEAQYCNDSFHHYPAPQNVLKEVHRVLKPEGTFLMGDCWQPFVGRVIMNFYMRHSKEGDVKIYSEAEIVSMLSEYFHNVSWEQIGNTACIAMAQK